VKKGKKRPKNGN